MTDRGVEFGTTLGGKALAHGNVQGLAFVRSDTVFTKGVQSFANIAKLGTPFDLDPDPPLVTVAGREHPDRAER